MQVAHALNKFEGEVLNLSPDEFARWIAFFKIKAREEKRAVDKAKNKAKITRRR